MEKPDDSMENQNIHGRTFRENAYDGTAARTRPLSFGEILRRRKVKEKAGHGDSVRGDVARLSATGVKGVNPENLESGDSRYMHPIDSSECSEKLLAEEPVDTDQRKKEVNTAKEDSAGKPKNRAERRGSLRNAEDSKRLSTRHKQRYDEHNRDGRKNDNKAGNALEDEATEAPKKRLKSLVVVDLSRERNDRKTERDHNWKSHNDGEQRVGEKRLLRRHELDKTRNLVLRRNDIKERFKVHSSDMSMQKRRSSRDQQQVKDRPHSRSPRVGKTMSHHLKEDEGLSLHSVKDHSGRYHHENERSKRERQISSGSGLGGYSPRKRRPEAPVKTSSPPKKLPEKKTPKWDLTPAITSSLFPTPNFAGLQSALQLQSLTVNTISSTALEPLGMVSLKIPPVKQNVDAVQLTESTRPMRRLYVENLPDAASEKTLMECFNNYLLSSGFNYIHGSEPCISCIINKEKGQALVEFLTPEDASSALSFNGHSFAGSALKIRRPKDFADTATSKPEKSQISLQVSTKSSIDAASKTASYVLSDNVEDSSKKIFVGGISKSLSPEMLREIANIFGPLKAYRFEFNEDLGQACAFLEYVDPSTTLKACSGLDGMKIGGKTITAVQALQDSLPQANKKGPAFYGIPQHAKPLLCEPTQVLKLTNVFDLECFPSLTDTEIEEILEDVRAECSRFGSVKSIKVVKNAKEDAASSGATVDGHSLGSNETVKECDSSNIRGFGWSEELGREGNQSDQKLHEKACDQAFDTAFMMQSGDKETGAVNREEINMKDRETMDKGSENIYAIANSDDTATEATKGSQRSKAEESRNPSTACYVEPDKIAPGDREPHSVDSRMTKKKAIVLDSDESAEKSWDETAVALKGDDAIVERSSPMAVGATVRDHDCIFQQGCVFVEFGRREASCEAAHCLHGRLFDNRIVAVEYVNIEDHRKRFQNR